MTSVPVRLPGRTYRVLIGRGLLRSAGTRMARLLKIRKVYVVTAAPVRRRHGAALVAACQRAAIRLVWLTVPDGERAKTWAVAGSLLRRLARHGAGRDAVVAAFGGGTVGDVAGLAASLYARGIRFVQIPTTLEAQVDAAIGGKTAVDLSEGKNLAGAFHQPVAVLTDPDLLRTLSARQLRAGLAEVVKYGVIASPRMFGWLERHTAEILRKEPRALLRIVELSTAIKATVVARDERDGGWRMILNFGHTAGHALESAGGFRRLLHGEAVAIGMVVAARFSAGHGFCPPAVPLRIEALLRRFGLPVEAPAWARRAALRAALLLDKKRVRGGMRLVLTRSIGNVTVKSGFSPDQLLAFLHVRR